MDQRLILIRNNKGAAVVELAITLPILLIVLFGIFEFGLIMYNKAVITNASREGARTGIVFKANATTGAYEPYTVLQIQGVVNTYLNNGNNLIPPAAPSVTVPSDVCTEVPSSPRPTLIVRVEYNYNFFVLPRLVTSITGPIQLVGETRMRCE